MSRLRRAALVLLGGSLWLVCGCRTPEPPAFDLVLAGGRVIDPGSGLDGMRHVGIRGDRITAVSEETLRGAEVLDVSGLVVAPGFIDLHAHGQDPVSNLYQAHDGVTSAFDMEAGVWPVDRWYASRRGKAVIHYGAAVGHIPVRMALKHGIEVGHPNTSPAMAEAMKLPEWRHEPLDAGESERLLEMLGKGLTAGALGIGMGIQYSPGATRQEVLEVFRLAARLAVPVFVHARYSGNLDAEGGLAAVQEVVAGVAATGAAVHLVHVTSTGMGQTAEILELIQGARGRGLDVTTEAYPYPAASTYLESSYFDPGWRRRYDIDYDDLQWVATGERLTEESFARYREQGGPVIIFMIPQPVVDLALGHPLVMVGSDGLPFLTGGEHPRGAGTFARVLGRFSRERGLLGLMEALGKMTFEPAQRLADWVPAMRRKGRVAEGADADLTVFDPERVRDRATYEEPTRFSEGIEHVLVAGTFVVRDGDSVEEVFPGRPVRAGG
ncbi:MAG: amidohydrolase family protein [Thermoanaerobaculia bacterium]